ncbi:MAG: GDSL-type esterase/lipase family protein [Patescibacteria group bacterium]|nr:GDSL-type esterase/lipase family protein [Patescibacteria group bacterium]
MDKNICVFGDSIVWGACDYEQGGWAERLKIFCAKNYEDVSVYNLGISGDNTDKLLKRFKGEARTRDPGIIIFAVGINDSYYRVAKKNPKVPLRRFKKNIFKLIKQAKKIEGRAIIVGLAGVDEKKTMPTTWDAELFYDDDNVIKYDNALKDICSVEGVKYAEIKSLLNHEDFEDGLHPNARGHEKIFQRVRDLLIDINLI